jgi:lipopolysaccharide export system permease protein
VVSAAGGSRMKVVRPVMGASLLVAVVMLLFTSIVAPAAQHMWREQITKVTVDLIANIVRPGRFSEIEKGLTFHIRDRAGDGSLIGLMIDDQRDKDIGYTYIAERANVVEVPGKTLLVMHDGNLQRVNKSDGALSLIDFEAYAFDLSELNRQDAKPQFRPSERSTWDLMTAKFDAADQRGNADKYRAELVDRFSQPLLPLAFASIVLLLLVDARTTRQGRGLAILGTFLLGLAVRALHFAASSASVGNAMASPLAFLVPLLVIAVSMALVVTDRTLSLPAPLERAIDSAFDLVAFVWRRLFGREGDPA